MAHPSSSAADDSDYHCRLSMLLATNEIASIDATTTFTFQHKRFILTTPDTFTIVFRTTPSPSSSTDDHSVASITHMYGTLELSVIRTGTCTLHYFTIGYLHNGRVPSQYRYNAHTNDIEPTAYINIDTVHLDTTTGDAHATYARVQRTPISIAEHVPSHKHMTTSFPLHLCNDQATCVRYIVDLWTDRYIGGVTHTTDLDTATSASN